MTHICVSNLTIIGSDNGLSPGRRQAIIWTNAGILLIGPLETNFSEIFIEILTFSFKKMRLKVSSAKRRPFCLGLNVLIDKMLSCKEAGSDGNDEEGGHKSVHWIWSFNTLRPRQDGRHFPDDIFRCIFLNENMWIAINISLSFVPKGPIDNIPALVRIMAWRRSGDKPLSEPMMVSSPTHICVTRPQWVKVYRYQIIGNLAHTSRGLFIVAVVCYT